MNYKCGISIDIEKVSFEIFELMEESDKRVLGYGMIPNKWLAKLLKMVREEIIKINPTFSFDNNNGKTIMQQIEKDFVVELLRLGCQA